MPSLGMRSTTARQSHGTIRVVPPLRPRCSRVHNHEGPVIAVPEESRPTTASHRVMRWRYPTQTTPQATACIAEAGPPRISAVALLQLAQWCQSRCGESSGQSGGPPCPNNPVSQSPPAHPARETSRTADPSLVGAPRAEASGSPAGAQPDDQQRPLVRSAKGGQS